ncbi:hypothetical protein [Moorena sp. SIO4E2]|nr:hypothetical protein [Moorena sp. SIO4E2]
MVFKLMRYAHATRTAISLSATRTLREQLSAIGCRPSYLRCF